MFCETCVVQLHSVYLWDTAANPHEVENNITHLNPAKGKYEVILYFNTRSLKEGPADLNLWIRVTPLLASFLAPLLIPFLAPFAGSFAGEAFNAVIQFWQVCTVSIWVLDKDSSELKVLAIINSIVEQAFDCSQDKSSSS